MKRQSRWLAALLALAMTTSVAGSAIPVSAAANGDTTYTIAQGFQNPGAESKPMARFWFPDAGAGLPDSDYKYMVTDLINELAEGGFGGVEITMLADSNSYDNDTAAQIGWGSDAWAEVLSTAVYAANQIEGGFRVDVTITAHWPPVINTIDPNDDEQQQELAYAYQKLTADDLTGSTDLALPVQKTEDFSNTNSLIATFLFQDKLVSSTLARVASVDSNGNPVLDYESMNAVSTSVKPDAGYAVGIPEKGVDVLVKKDGQWVAGTTDDYTTLNERIAVYNSSNKYVEGAVIEKTGDMPWNQRTTVTLNGVDITGQVTVIDANTPVIAYTDADGDQCYTSEGIAVVKNNDTFGDRERMADWQDIYQVSREELITQLGTDGVNAITNDKDVSTLKEGDYVLVNTYRRGTGQIMSGGQTITMNNRTYAVDYFNEDGIKEVTEYWNQKLLPHVSPDCGGKSLKELMQENGGSIFEDSIEIHKTGSIWTAHMLEDFQNDQGYDISSYLPIIAGMSASSSTGQDTGRVKEDYNLVLGHLYSSDHADVIKDWTASFGCTYRAQAYVLTGLDVAGAAAAVDIPEGDNSTSGDGIRNLASATNIADKEYLSMEALTSASDHPVWFEALREINGNLSDGINRIILHGTPFTKSYTDVNNAWPGWTFMSYGCWAPRQPFWEDMDTISNYFGRIQTVLQDGTAKIPVAILNDQTSAYNCLNGDSFDKLLDNGYTYNILSEVVLEEEGAVAKDGVLCPDGPAYQAMILNSIENISCETLEKINSYADAGVKIYVYNSSPSKVYGTEKEGNNDALVAELYSELIAKDGVTVISDSDADAAQQTLLDQLKADKVEPGASYDCDGLEVTRLTDPADGTNYYFFFNESYEGTLGSAGMGHDYSGATFLDIDVPVTLEGSGAPYLMDPATGEVTPVSEYTLTEDGKVQFTLSLKALNTMVVAVSDNTKDFPVSEAHVTKQMGGEGKTKYVDGKLVYRTETAGDSARVVLDDGTVKTISVDKVADKIELGGDNTWNLDIQSWGPDSEANAVDPTISTKTDITAGETTLELWEDLSIPEEELAKAGVDDPGKLSGIGIYTDTVTLPDDWTDDMGAIFTFKHEGMASSGGGWPGGGSATETLQNNKDMITEITVTNDEGTYTISDINPLNDEVDLTTFLNAGENTITVKLTTTLENREDGKATANYGLTDAALVPYTQVEVAASEETDVNTFMIDAFIKNAQGHIDSGEVDQLIPLVKEEFYSAFDNAVSVRANSKVQEEIDSAALALLHAIQMLDFKVGDKTALNTLIEYCDSLNLDKYEDNLAKEAFKIALKSAKLVSKDENAMQNEIDNAYKILDAAVTALVEKDTYSLDQLIKQAQVIQGQLDRYVENGQAAFLEALEAALAVQQNTSSTQAEIDEAADTLLSSMVALRLKADKSYLNQLLAEAAQIDLSVYTEAAVDAFRSAYDNAVAVAENPDLSEDDQLVVDQAAGDLQKALNGLKGTDAPAISGDSSASGSSSTPKTGETVPAAAAALLTLSCGILILRNKKHAK